MATKNSAKRAWQAPDAQLQQVWNSVRERFVNQADWPDFDERVRQHLPALRDELQVLYGQRVDFTPEDSQKGPRAGDVRLIEG